MISEVAFQAVHVACDPLGAVNMRTACTVRVATPPPGASDMCYQRGESDFICPLTNISDPAFGCCQALDASMDTIGTVNIYNLYGRCDQPSDGSTGPHQSWGLHPRTDQVSAWGLEGTDSVLPFGLDGCWGSSELFTAYLNRDDVRAAIHVKSSAEFAEMYSTASGSISIEADTAWAGCGMKNVVYDSGESANLLPLYAYLAERPEIRMLIFNGDVDACVPWVGAEEWITKVSTERGWVNSVAWQPWTVDSQVAGYVSQWSEIGFTFATVYGAGHVSRPRPLSACVVFQQLFQQLFQHLFQQLFQELNPGIEIPDVVGRWCQRRAPKQPAPCSRGSSQTIGR
jgi:hypothetical protein